MKSYIIIAVFLFFVSSLILTKRLDGGINYTRYIIKKNIHQHEIKKIINTRDTIKLPEFKIENSEIIPKIIHQTHKSKDLIPKYYIDNLKKINKGWKYNFHSNQEASEFLRKNYGKQFSDKFDSFKTGPHKADLWRLCVLYKYGGCYIDADIEMQISFDKLINLCKEDLIIPCSKMINSRERIFNALIICKPMDSKIGECIKKLMMVDVKTLSNFYHFNLELMHEILRDKLNYKIYEEYLPKSKINIYLDPKDCYIVTNNKNIIANSKRKDYI